MSLRMENGFILFLAPLLSLMVLLTACELEDAVKDTVAPEIRILTPKTLDTLASGDSVLLRAQLKDAGGLHEYIFRVQSASGDSVFFYLGGHNHASDELITEKALFTVKKKTELVFSVKANDHSANVGESSVHFIVKP